MDDPIEIGHCVNRDFTVWQRSVHRLTSYAVLASVAGTGFIAVALALAHSVLTNTSGVASVGPLDVELPDAMVFVMLIAAVMLTVSSVVQSGLRKVDAILVRLRLTEVSNACDPPMPARVLMSERFLMEGWTHWVASLVQALGFSAILVWLGGPLVFLGILMGALIAVAIGRRFFGRALVASTAFLDAQRNANSLQRRAQTDRTLDDEVGDALSLVTAAVYRRDNEAFRLTSGAVAFLSISIIICSLAPALLSMPSGSLPVYLIVFLMWRQRVIDSVTTLGMLAWTLTVWRDAPNPTFFDEPGAVDFA